MSFFKRYFKVKRLQRNRDLLNYYDKKGFHREMLDSGKIEWSIFSKDFKEGNEIYWLGHDNVFGLLHGQKIIADKESVEKKNQLSFWREVDRLNFE